MYLRWQENLNLNFEQYLWPRHLDREVLIWQAGLLCEDHDKACDKWKSSQCLASAEAPPGRISRSVACFACTAAGRQKDGVYTGTACVYRQPSVFTTSPLTKSPFTQPHLRATNTELFTTFIRQFVILRQLKGVPEWAPFGVWAPSRCEWGSLQDSPVGKIFLQVSRTIHPEKERRTTTDTPPPWSDCI